MESIITAALRAENISTVGVARDLNNLVYLIFEYLARKYGELLIGGGYTFKIKHGVYTSIQLRSELLLELDIRDTNIKLLLPSSGMRNLVNLRCMLGNFCESEVVEIQGKIMSGYSMENNVMEGQIHSHPELSSQASGGKDDVILQYDMNETEMCDTTRYGASMEFVLTSSSSSRRSMAELRDMNDMQGYLSILNLKHVTTKEEAAEACLWKKKGLVKVELLWGNVCDEKNPNHEEILKSLQPPIGIEVLEISNYRGGAAPFWMGNHLFSKLIKVVLSDCTCFDPLQSLGELPFLRVLHIFGNNEVVEFNTYSCRNESDGVAFRKLVHLVLDSMSKLEKWTRLEKGDFPVLRYLAILRCPEFVSLPSVSHLDYLSHLDIAHCPKFSCLPDDGLPPDLRLLIIEDCATTLKEQLRDKQGDEWLKVAHVPRLRNY